MTDFSWLDSVEVKPSKYQSFRMRNPDYQQREQKRNSNRDRTDYNEDRREDRKFRPFVGWDTEGTNVDATPFLFGSSEGDYLAHPQITSIEMFELVLEREQEMPDAIHVIYGGEYDFNMMLRDLDRKNLWALKRYNKTTWKGYRIEHIPRKWMVIKRDGIVAKIFDVVSFFACPYVDALVENQIGTVEELDRVKAGKELRSGFTFDDLDVIEPYWRTELKLLPQLMDKLRSSFYQAGVFIHSWHGPGSLARYMLKEHKIKSRMAKVPEPVHEAARYAFCGGRFESFMAGRYDGIVYNADVNSAYPYAATLLPDLSNGRWEYVSGKDIDRSEIRKTKFAIYHIEYKKLNRNRRGLCMEPQPLFRRMQDDRVMWPNVVTGWYWSPEAYTVRDNRYATFLGAWVFHDSGYRPFKWLSEYYDHRLVLKRQKNPMQLAFKLGPNSVYGQLAMRAGWERYKGPPTFHQIEWAGFVTSMCRSMVYETAMYAWENNGLISIDTDGVFSSVPLPDSILENGSGTGLGQWETSNQTGMLNWQSGVYWLKDGRNDTCRDCQKGSCPEWHLRKARGAPKGKIPFSAAMEALSNLGDVAYERNELIGYRWGLRNGMDRWRYFTVKPRTLKFGGSEFSKRFHSKRGCRVCRGFMAGTLHDLTPIGNGFTRDYHSKMHVLPWEVHNDHQRTRDLQELKTEIEIDEIWAEEDNPMITGTEIIV